MEVVEPVKKKKKIVKSRRPKVVKTVEEEKVNEPATNNSFNYSLYDGHSEEQNS